MTTADACVKTLTGHTENLTFVFLTHDLKWVVSASLDGQTFIWDFETGKRVGTIKWGNPSAKATAVSGLGQWIVSADRSSGQICVWNRETRQCIRKMEHRDFVLCVATDVDGNWIASADASRIHIWDTSELSDKPVRTLRDRGLNLTCVAMSLDGMWVAAGSRDNAVRVWDRQTGLFVNVFEQQHQSWIGAVCFAEAGNHCLPGRRNYVVVSGDHQGVVHVWNLKAKKPTKTIQTQVGWILSLSVDASGQQLVVGGTTSTPEVHDLTAGGSKMLEGHSPHAAITAVAMTGNGQYAATGSEDQSIKIWRV